MKKTNRTSVLSLRRILSMLAILLICATVLVACGDDDENGEDASPASGAGLTVDLDGMRIVDAWVRPGLASGDAGTATGMGMEEDGGGITTGAAYMTLENTTGEVRHIVRASTDVAETVELHETTMNAGLMQMAPVPSLDVPANGTLVLKPGGLHVMLIGLTRDLVVGDTITLTLETDAGETLTLEGIPVREPGT